MTTENTQQLEKRYIARLSPDVYNDLEKRMGTLQMNQTVTELQAGYALGIQAVLKELRNGLVVPG